MKPPWELYPAYCASLCLVSSVEAGIQLGEDLLAGGEMAWYLARYFREYQPFKVIHALQEACKDIDFSHFSRST